MRKQKNNMSLVLQVGDPDVRGANVGILFRNYIKSVKNQVSTHSR